MKAIVYSILAMTIFMSCKTKPNQESDSDYPFIGCWTHSMEENPNYESPYIYRPCDYKEFPVSRFRQTFQFMQNGECSWNHLADNDAHYTRHGKWTFDEDSMTIDVHDENDKVRFKLKIVE